MKILFVGHTWKGSSARSLREGLSLIPDVDVDEIGEDHYIPAGKSLAIRLSNRLLRKFYQAEVKAELFRKLNSFKPDVLLIYKGSSITQQVITLAKGQGVVTVNVFPDFSPHAYGKQLKRAMGEYDLVISTKPFHPANWADVYGYHNQCIFVPHGYDPAVHYWGHPPVTQDIDLAMVAGWRPQYEKLVVKLTTCLDTRNMRVVIGGPGWDRCRKRLPSHWEFLGGIHGRSYGEVLRRAKIIIAPVNREVNINGHAQPGDEDTTRTYELAAAHCFFLHQRTPYVRTLYSDTDEVPMWDTPAELAALILKYLPLDNDRKRIAEAAHRRATPAYSIPERAKEVLNHLQKLLSDKS